MAGTEIIGGLDAWEPATKSFQLNFPSASVFHGRAESFNPNRIKAAIGDVDILLASPECTSHSVAKGSAPRCEISRATAFEVVRYAKAFDPRWIVVENVTRMQNWARFEEWMQSIHGLGYQTCVAVINSQDCRTPQSRKRLFVLCDKDYQPTPPPNPPGEKISARGILGKGESARNPWVFRPLREGVQAKATLERAGRAIAAFGKDVDFILVYYGTDGAGGYQSLERPLRTVTTLDRFAYVRPTETGHEIRMLQPPELAAAMGFPASHQWPDISRRDKIKLIGNGVCPPVMKAVVRNLTKSTATRPARAT